MKLISISADQIKNKIPSLEHGRSYIYALMNGGECLYVGQSQVLKRRLYTHLADGKEFSEVVFYSCDERQANNEEAKTIVDRQPEFNANLPKNDLFVSLTALASTFEKRIKDGGFMLDVVYSPKGKSTLYMEARSAERILSDFEVYIKTTATRGK